MELLYRIGIARIVQTNVVMCCSIVADYDIYNSSKI